MLPYHVLRRRRGGTHHRDPLPRCRCGAIEGLRPVGFCGFILNIPRSAICSPSLDFRYSLRKRDEPCGVSATARSLISVGFCSIASNIVAHKRLPWYIIANSILKQCHNNITVQNTLGHYDLLPLNALPLRTAVCATPPAGRPTLCARAGSEALLSTATAAGRVERGIRFRFRIRM